MARTGRRSAGIGERNIHHADCTNVKVNVHTGELPRCKNQAHLSKHSYWHTVGGVPGREAQPSRYRLQTPYGYHTPDNIPSFFSSVKTLFWSFPTPPALRAPHSHLTMLMLRLCEPSHVPAGVQPGGKPCPGRLLDATFQNEQLGVHRFRKRRSRTRNQHLSSITLQRPVHERPIGDLAVTDSVACTREGERNVLSTMK